MRLIGHLPSEDSARVFGDYLLVQGIESQLEFEKGSGWGIWVGDEDKLAAAGALLAAFLQDPSAARFHAGAKDASRVRAEREKDEAAYRQRLRNRRYLFRPLTGYGFGVLTYILIVISVIVFVLSKFATDFEPVHGLFFSEVAGGFRHLAMPEIRHGEVWRLFTPMFLHFGALHIIFNLLWLRDLGSMIEARQSPWQLAAIVLVVAGCSDLAQYYFTGPTFGGMSGVVYGLLGYIWIRGRLDPGSGLYVHPSTVVMMILWFFACFSGLLGNIANTAHAVGLGLGMAWGYLSSQRYR